MRIAVFGAKPYDEAFLTAAAAGSGHEHLGAATLLRLAGNYLRSNRTKSPSPPLDGTRKKLVT